MELILTKGYDSITVQEITDRANLGRATFYLHYPGGKEELLLSSLKSIIDDLILKLRETTRESILTRPASLIAFQHADANRKLYRVMLGPHGTSSLTSKIRAIVADAVQQQISVLAGGEALPVPLEVMGQHIAGALLALITWWLETNAPYTPEEMAHMMHRLTAQPIITRMVADGGLVRPAQKQAEQTPPE
jgi:AcrR family transcriptional regulator